MDTFNKQLTLPMGYVSSKGDLPWELVQIKRQASKVVAAISVVRNTIQKITTPTYNPTATTSSVESSTQSVNVLSYNATTSMTTYEWGLNIVSGRSSKNRYDNTLPIFALDDFIKKNTNYQNGWPGLEISLEDAQSKYKEFEPSPNILTMSFDNTQTKPPALNYSRVRRFNFDEPQIGLVIGERVQIEGSPVFGHEGYLGGPLRRLKLLEVLLQPREGQIARIILAHESDIVK